MKAFASTASSADGLTGPRAEQEIIGSMGLDDPSEIEPWMLIRPVDEVRTSSFAELYDWLEPRELLTGPAESWAADWQRADPDSFKGRRIRGPSQVHRGRLHVPSNR